MALCRVPVSEQPTGAAGAGGGGLDAVGGGCTGGVLSISGRAEHEVAVHARDAVSWREGGVGKLKLCGC